jgi:hypothetical protein
MIIEFAPFCHIGPRMRRVDVAGDGFLVGVSAGWAKVFEFG